MTSAIELGTNTYSYAQLDQKAGALAGTLHSVGVGAGDLVAICLPRSFDQIAALVAARWLGAAYLPLDPAWPQARITDLVNRAGCAALVVDTTFGPVPVVDCPIVDHASAPEGSPPPRAPVDPDSLAYVIYTSGSTGAPKGVEVTHGNLAALIDWHVANFDIGPGTRTSHLAGLGFDASAWEVWPTLAAGGTLVLADEAVRTDPAALRDWLVAKNVAVAFAPTALAEPLARMEWPSGTGLRILLTGADRLTQRPVPGLPFALVNNYGPTECTVVATSGEVTCDGDSLPAIGKPIARTLIHIFDDSGEPARDGEIWIGGPQVARGYRHDPAATAERFVVHPAYGRLYRTGDRAAWLESGAIAFLGRVDHQVKIRGYRVEPAEVTAALKRCPGISDGVVVARPGQSGDELVAYVVMAAGMSVSAADLRALLAHDLPDFMVPARYAALGSLPLTANGKLDIRALPDPAACPLDRAAAARPPSTPTEQHLFRIIADVIGRDDFGVDDDFFLLGGHSLLGTQVIVRARDAFGVELNLFHLFEGRTVAVLSAKVEELVIERLASLSDEDIARMAAS